MFDREVWNPVGRWRVTTEGDVEGRSTTELGFYDGHIADIARKLAGKAYYGLYFAKAEEVKPDPKPPAKVEVDIHLDIKSGTWDLTSAQRKAYFKEMMKGRSDVEVSESNYFASVKLTLKRKKK